MGYGIWALWVMGYGPGIYGVWALWSMRPYGVLGMVWDIYLYLCKDAEVHSLHNFQLLITSPSLILFLKFDAAFTSL